MLSIIIPTFNRASFLREAIQSVLAQDQFETLYSSGEIEILIVDDGSSDGTRDIVEAFRPRVKYYYQTHKGVSSARNKGLRLAKGNLIAFLDSDDLWNRDKLRIQMNFMNAFPKVMVCYTEEIWIRRGVFVNPKKKHKKYSGYIFDKVLTICLLSLSSAMFRREVFDEVGCFDEEFPACEDYDFGIRVAQKYPVYLIRKPLIVKRGGHADQLSRKYWGMDRFRIRALEKALTLDLTLEQRRLVEQELIKKCQVLVAGYKKRNKMKDAQKYLQLIDKYKKKEEGT
ncbi:MAG: glycosyltransferase [Candidatus Aminicenantes bacterium]|nr:glycosyltransferase [Candidatus Aminicenantes bacterium]